MMVNALLYSFHIIPLIFDFFKIPESTTRLGSHFPRPHQSSSVRTPSSFDGRTGHFRSDEPLKDIRYDEKNCD